MLWNEDKEPSISVVYRVGMVSTEYSYMLDTHRWFIHESAGFHFSCRPVDSLEVPLHIVNTIFALADKESSKEK